MIEVLKELVYKILNSHLLGYFMLILRIITPFVSAFVVWRCFTSFKKGLRRREPVIILREKISGCIYPVLYWENSIGRSKSCDIVIDDPTVSRDHAVLMRREEGWLVCDTGSKQGVKIDGTGIEDRELLGIGDTITIGRTSLILESAEVQDTNRRKVFRGFSRDAASPSTLLLLATFVHFLMTIQLCFGTGEIDLKPLVSFGSLVLIGWALYFISRRVCKRVNFEIETVAFLLSGIGIMLLSGISVEDVFTQIIAMILGISVFLFLVWFIGDADRVTKWRLVFAIGAIGFFILNLLIGKEINGSKNWIYIGSFSIQPSELIKIAFVFVGASTLDKLQTKKNITEFIIFGGACLGFLFIMRDFGTACIFFAGFLIIAFMRSGSIRTIALILAVAVLGVFMIITFKPYVAQRFEGWGNIWAHVYDSLGYQQTRSLTYIASGGFFGMGLGTGYVHYIAAGDSDLVFAMLCEEQGILLGYVVVFAIALFILYVRSDVTRSRSTFYSISSCAVAGILLFQTCLNIFGITDILPLTGVTLPFISSGGSSMMACWGLLAFIKASDERTYGVKRARKDSYEDISS